MHCPCRARYLRSGPADGTDAVAGKPFAHGAYGHAIFLEAVDAAPGGSQPHAAFVVFVHASNDLIGEPVAGLIGRELPSANRLTPAPSVAIHSAPSRSVRSARTPVGVKPSRGP